MNTAVGLIEKFGPVEGMIIYAVIFTLIYIFHSWSQGRKLNQEAINPIQELNSKIAANAAEINMLRATKGSTLNTIGQQALEFQKEIARLELLIEKRVPFDWAEEKLLPKIDELGKDVGRLGVNLEVQTKMAQAQMQIHEQLTTAIKTLTTTIQVHDDRLRKLERQT